MKKLIILTIIAGSLLNPAAGVASDSSASTGNDVVRIGSWNNDPFHDEMSRNFDNLFNSIFDRAFGGAAHTARIAHIRYPKSDMYETTDNVVISVEMPGIKKEDVNLEIANNVVSISYEQKQDNEKKEKNYSINERSYSSFKRLFSLPRYADGSKAAAEYKDGLLTISVPKLEEAKVKPKKIEIK